MINVMDRVAEHYDIVLAKGYETVGIFLQGSQNYELDYEGSDVDTKVIVLPTFEDFVTGAKPVSCTLELENKEHIDLKDIRLMFECFRKQNINFVEILFTKYKILNPEYEEFFVRLIERREEIARYNTFAAVNCMAGMSLEKYKALEHPYEGLREKIERYGYDAKQLHHIMRMNDFIRRYVAGEAYEQCLIPRRKDLLIRVKQNLYPLESARVIAKTLTDDTVSLKNEYMNTHTPYVNRQIDDLMKQVLIDIMGKNIKRELLREITTL